MNQDFLKTPSNINIMNNTIKNIMDVIELVTVLKLLVYKSNNFANPVSLSHAKSPYYFYHSIKIKPFLINY